MSGLFRVFAITLCLISFWPAVASADEKLKCDPTSKLCDRWLDEIPKGKLDVTLANGKVNCKTAKLKLKAETPQEILGKVSVTGADIQASFDVLSDWKGPWSLTSECLQDLEFGGAQRITETPDKTQSFTFEAQKPYAIDMLGKGLPGLTCTKAELKVAGSEETDPPACELKAIGTERATVLCQFDKERDGLNLELYCGGSNAPVDAATFTKIGTGSAQVAKREEKPDGRSTVLAATSLPPDVWEHILKELRLPAAERQPGHYYDRSQDVAVVFLNADGHPYYPDLDIIDENDTIYVVVVDRDIAVDDVTVEITGCDRPPLFRVYRPAGETISGETGKRQVAEPKWTWIIRPVGTCAASDGGVSAIVNREGEARAATIRTNPLYNFSVGFALGYDDTTERTFGVRTAAGDTVPRIAEINDKIGLGTLFFVSFYPLPRDFQKRDFLLPERFKLFVALDLEDLDEHLIAGAGYELLPGFDALVGWRVLTRQIVLAEGSGLENGSRFDGPASELPTRDRWEQGRVFIGLGLTTNVLTELSK